MDLIAFEREQDARARKLLVFTRVQLRPTVNVILFVVQSQRAQPLQFVLAPIAKVELKIFVRDKRHYFVGTTCQVIKMAVHVNASVLQVEIKLVTMWVCFKETSHSVPVV